MVLKSQLRNYIEIRETIALPTISAFWWVFFFFFFGDYNIRSVGVDLISVWAEGN
jgi:hypothetical protein